MRKVAVLAHHQPVQDSQPPRDRKPAQIIRGLESNNLRMFVLDAGDLIGWVLATGWMLAGADPNRYENPLIDRGDWSPDAVFVTPSYVGRYADRGAHHRWWERSGAQELSRILLDEWDPLGMREAPEAANKYDAYLGSIGSRLSAGVSTQDIAAFLGDVEEVRMGIAPTATGKSRNEALAARLSAWYANAIEAEES